MANLIDYFEFDPCCQGVDTLYFSGDSTDLIWPATYIYQGECYSVHYLFNMPSPGNLVIVPVAELSPVSDCDDLKCECCKCIRVRNKNISTVPVYIDVIDCEDIPVQLLIPIDRVWSEKICASSWIADPDIFEVDVTGNCVDGLCPLETCFLLTDCEGIEEDIYATYASMQASINTGAVIKIDGFPDTCWSFREISECDCAIEVTVLSTWVDCEECRKCKGYKLTNCENEAYIKYTTNDLSDYIGKAVEFEDCPGCWFVECMEITPPQDQNLVVEFSFDTCRDCLSKFWKLTSCLGDADPIFTDTDLSNYEGFIITLDGIPETCWQLEEVRDLEGEDFQTVFVNTYYADCDTCFVDVLPCQCSTAVNKWTLPTKLTYLGCDGIWYDTPILTPGERSTRYCVARWSTIGKFAGDIEFYGDCTEISGNPLLVPPTITTWECPVVVPIFRKVKPGYEVPTCTPEYFDKVSCQFAETMYAMVLEERYGIVTSCTPENKTKWEIKKEMLNLDSLINPDYDCPDPECTCGCPTPITCCCPAPTTLCDGEALICGAYEAVVPIGYSGITTYRDCTGMNQVIETAVSGVEVTYSLCAWSSVPVVHTTTNDTETNVVDLISIVGCGQLGCMSYVLDRAPAAQTFASVTYKDCNGDMIITPTELIGEDGLCLQFCASDDIDPVVTITGLLSEQYTLDPIRLCTPEDADLCIGVNFKVSGVGTGTVTYTDCAGQSQIITYDGTEPIDQLTFACLASPLNYVVAGTIDIKLAAGTCEC